MPRLLLMPRFAVFLLALISPCAKSAPTVGYYDSAQGKSGLQLRRALHAIITNALVISYSNTTNALMVLDQDPANTNNVILIYSGFSTAKTNFNATNIFGWDREHLWPNSYGIDMREPAYSDIHNLRPIDKNVNSSRYNRFYDFSDPNDTNYHFPAFPEAPLCSRDTDSWEPPDSMKGDIARVLFYMDVRYEGDRTNESDLTLTSDTVLITSNTNRMGRLSTVLQWNQLDPVDGREIQRNDAVFENYQHNRNPFVDHPEWADLIYRPLLSAVRDSNSIQLSWSAEFSNVVLESKSILTNSWSTLTATATKVADTFVLHQPLTNGVRFYRLRLP